MNTRKLFILCVCLLAICFLQAQDKIPQAISYQAVARDAQGKVVSEKTISVKVEILKGSADGNVVFSETHTLTSSKTGTVNLLIGQGSAGSGMFASIDWGSDIYFLQLSMDLAGGTNYEKVSTTQMLPVPYALYAAKAGVVTNEGNDSGNIGSVVDFVFIPDGYAIKEMNEVLAGKNIEIDQWEELFTGYVIYLNGKDQRVEFSVEGLPEGYYEKIKSSHSANGRFIGYSIVAGKFNDFPRRTYPLVFTLQNKYGLKKEYKCTMVVK